MTEPTAVVTSPDTPSPLALRRRARGTRRSLLWMDRISSAVITVGGIGTIVAIAAVMLFLCWVALPLLGGGTVEPEPTGRAAWPTVPAHLAADEYRALGRALWTDGRIEVFRLDSGERLDVLRLHDVTPTAVAVWEDQQRLAVGLPDGRVALGTMTFVTEFLDAAALPAALRALAEGAVATWSGGAVQRTPEGQWRHQRLAVAMREPLGEPGPHATFAVDLTLAPGGAPVVAWLTGDGRLQIRALRETTDLISGAVTTEVRAASVAVAGHGRGRPRFLAVGGIGDTVLCAWPDGHAVRYDCRSLDDVAVAETLDLVPEPEVELTALGWLIGRGTLLAGDSRGRVHLWFRVARPDAGLPDGAMLARARAFEGPAAPVRAFGPSPRDRTFAAGFADGTVRSWHATSEKLVADVRCEPVGAVAACAFTPKGDGILAATAAGYGHWTVTDPHADASAAALFAPVWYEGYPAPEHVWQSSSGTDEFEAKLGLWPLIFGSFKATLFCMLFGVPIALLAAIYTSEFMHPRWRTLVKPTIELMASLPSVVLGFLAALVLAPIVERVVPAVLALAVTVPGLLVVGAWGWQALPPERQAAWERWRPACIAAVVPLGVVAALGVGPLLERACFAGDLHRWLDGQVGGAAGGWFVLALPPAALGAALGVRRWASPWIRRRSAPWSRRRIVAAQGAKLLLGALATLGVAVALAAACTGLGLDTRGPLVGTYVQRNALVVGFVMGFAIIPIIYTIAEDALTTVPNHLRLASLGAGATPWQTALRVVIPTAMSGLFSAVMIGLGRAVGETMIVLMAAGNTPVMEWNVFNGFRTLSATIAVELPEAVRDSTHYRTLFLAALTLLAMTSVLNTGAELVRLRFRRRAGAL